MDDGAPCAPSQAQNSGRNSQVCSVPSGQAVRVPFPSHTRQPYLHPLSSSSSKTLSLFISWPPMLSSPRPRVTQARQQETALQTLQGESSFHTQEGIFSESLFLLHHMSLSGGDRGRERHLGCTDTNTWIIDYRYSSPFKPC